jgi:cell division protein FtsL
MVNNYFMFSQTTRIFLFIAFFLFDIIVDDLIESKTVKAGLLLGVPVLVGFVCAQIAIFFKYLQRRNCSVKFFKIFLALFAVICIITVVHLQLKHRQMNSSSEDLVQANKLMIIHPFTPMADKYLYVSNVTSPIDKEYEFVCLDPILVEWQNNSTRIPQKEEMIGESASFFGAIKIVEWVGWKRGIAIGVGVGYSVYRYARGESLIPEQVWGKLREIYQNPKALVDIQLYRNVLR